MFFRTPSLLPILYPGLVWRMPANENKIYLTFDDGPMPGPTNFVLDQLHVFGAKATFFCIGDNVTKHNVLFHQLRNSGHSIGNHTFNHIKGWQTQNDSYIHNIDRCQQVIGETKLFRPPYGRIKRSQVQMLKKYRIIMWDVLTYDYSQSMSSERCLKGILKSVRPGSIVVFHDSLKAEHKMQFLLPRVLDHFTNRNFVFDSIPEL